MFRTSGARDGSGEIAMMLEKIEMPPSKILEIMRLAHLTAFRTRVVGAPISLYAQVELMRFFIDIKALTNKFPRWSEPEAQGNI